MFEPQEDLARSESVLEDPAIPAPLDPAELPLDTTAPRALLPQREAEHAAELQAVRAGLQEQMLRNEQLKLRLAKLLRERFGASLGTAHGNRAVGTDLGRSRAADRGASTTRCARHAPDIIAGTSDVLPA
jgi:hypothetical protein